MKTEEQYKEAERLMSAIKEIDSGKMYYSRDGFFEMIAALNSLNTFLIDNNATLLDVLVLSSLGRGCSYSPSVYYDFNNSTDIVSDLELVLETEEFFSRREIRNLNDLYYFTPFPFLEEYKNDDVQVSTVVNHKLLKSQLTNKAISIIDTLVSSGLMFMKKDENLDSSITVRHNSKDRRTLFFNRNAVNLAFTIKFGGSGHGRNFFDSEGT